MKRQRTVVTTDPELDDLNSMLRLLLYSNEIDLEALVYTASIHHWAGDPARRVEPHRWPRPGESLHIDQAIDAYETVFPCLRVHDPAYPDPALLRSRTAVGNISTCGDMSEETEGSQLLERAMLSDDPRPLFVQNWGGMNTTARALRSIEERHRARSDWNTFRQEVSAGLVLTSFAEQDDAFRDYIRVAWPEIPFWDVATKAWGYDSRDVVDGEGLETLSARWMQAHVSSVGPVGRAYRVWGDGREMAAGDTLDYFWLSGVAEDELRSRGYEVWTPVQESGSWVSEGDSSNFALLVPNGLRSHENPEFGGWGGRLTPHSSQAQRWGDADASEADTEGSPRPGWSAARWLPDFQRDFAARLKWTVSSDFAAANHPPQVRAVGPVNRTVHPRERIELRVLASDPDGDSLDIQWWVYPEAGTFRGPVRLDASGLQARLVVPDALRVGETIHVIATVRDNGSPSLARYARFVLIGR